MKKGKRIILAVSAIVALAAVVAAVYLFIIRLRNGAIICSRESDN